MAKFIFDYDAKINKGTIQSDYLENVREHFSVEDPTAKIKQLRYGHYIPSRKYAITPTGRFDVGMFPEIYKYITTLTIPYTIIVTQLLKNKFKLEYPFKDCELVVLSKPLRDYQTEVVKKALAQGNGTIVVATAGGKTLIMATLIETINKNLPDNKTLVIVPGVQLVEQTYNDFIEYGVNPNKITKWSGKNKLDSTSSIVIAGTNILQSKNTDLTMLDDIKLLIIDECHKWKKSNEISKLFKHVNTEHIYGLTGTLPADKIDEWNIIGKIGPILYEKSSYDLRDEKYIAQAKIQIIKVDYKNKLQYTRKSSFLEPTAMYEEECEFIYNNPFRNILIGKLCNSLDKNLLVLVDRIKHGEELESYIKRYAPNKKIYFIQGSVEIEDREKIRKLMESTEQIVCIAMSSIFSTGIDIKNLHYIIFACVGKAKVKIIQSIGRGLRLHESKTQLIVFDICDDLIYGMQHLKKRLQLYEAEKIPYNIKEIRES